MALNISDNTFQRSWYLTVIGLMHVTYGFISTLWSVLRVLYIGPAIIQPFGSGYMSFIFLYESHSILLWISGIGILRNKRWGIILGLAWCLVTLLFSIINYFIRAAYWGPAAPSLQWGFYLVLYYTIAYSFGFFIIPLIRQHVPLSDLFDVVRNIDFGSVKNRLAEMKIRRNR